LAAIAKVEGNKGKQVSSVGKVKEAANRRVWRVLDTSYDDPIFNLALEEAIIEKVGAGEAPNTLSFWRNPDTVVVVGKFQIPELEVNKLALRKYSATVIRRFTGGGTVCTDQGSLNYSIIVNRDDPIVPKVISEVAPTFCEGVIEGLGILGLNAEFEPEGVYISIHGKKVSGTAGLIKRSVVFIHGTLLVNSDLTKLREILNVPPYPPGDKLRRYVKSIHRDITSIEAELHAEATIIQVKEAIKEGFAKALKIVLQEEEPLESEIALAKEIAAKKSNEIVISMPDSRSWDERRNT
jgi:lipoate-protein ligase A